MDIPDMDRLVACAESTANATKLRPPAAQAIRSFLQDLLFKPQSENGKDFWRASRAGLITEVETRNAIMAHYSTWLARENECPERDGWATAELEAAYEVALFGRPATINPEADVNFDRGRLVAGWRSLPQEVRRRPATEGDLLRFEAAHVPIPEEFRWFLLACGGGVVGSEWVDGIEQLSETHRKFSEESRADNGWKMQDVFVIGWDGGGNPFGIELASTDVFGRRRVVVEDHQFGGIHRMAWSFESFVAYALGVRP